MGPAPETHCCGVRPTQCGQSLRTRDGAPRLVVARTCVMALKLTPFFSVGWLPPSDLHAKYTWATSTRGQRVVLQCEINELTMNSNSAGFSPTDMPSGQSVSVAIVARIAARSPFLM